MAEENQDGQEKTEEPTAKRLSEAREKGQVARSRELNTMSMTMIGVVTLMMMLDYFGNGFWSVSTANFQLDRADLFDTGAMIRHLSDAIRQALLLLMPFFAVMITVAIVSSVVLGGLSFSTKSMAPKLDKMSPLKGVKRMFSIKSVMELVKALAKFFLIGGTTVLLLWQSMDLFLGLSAMDLQPAMVEVASLIGWSVLILSSTLILIAAIDVPFQLWQHKKQLRMTKQEVRDEMKQTEGDPHVKGRIRGMQREAATRRMMEDVPTADVIVTNPTHFAVALKYDQDNMGAPQVVAKGSDLVAANIRRVGEANDVPVIESPMLARALYFSTEIGDAIPQGLYLAVAKLLAYVFQLRSWNQQGGDIPSPPDPDDFPIPEEYQTPPVDDSV